MASFSTAVENFGKMLMDDIGEMVCGVEGLGSMLALGFLGIPLVEAAGNTILIACLSVGNHWMRSSTP